LQVFLFNLDAGSQYYQQPSNQTLDPAAFVQAINTEFSVSAPLALPTNLTNYQVKYYLYISIK
jgi:hypothetical protein